MDLGVLSDFFADFEYISSHLLFTDLCIFGALWINNICYTVGGYIST